MKPKLKVQTIAERFDEICKPIRDDAIKKGKPIDELQLRHMKDMFFIGWFTFMEMQLKELAEMSDEDGVELLDTFHSEVNAYLLQRAKDYGVK